MLVSLFTLNLTMDTRRKTTIVEFSPGSNRKHVLVNNHLYHVFVVASPVSGDVIASFNVAKVGDTINHWHARDFPATGIPQVCHSHAVVHANNNAVLKVVIPGNGTRP